MSRILEFQPTDEQTIVARVLVELHQAIDVHFPNAKPSAKQFSRTVLTNQGESTRIDNIPPSGSERQAAGAQSADAEPNLPDATEEFSLTPRTGMRGHPAPASLQTAQIRNMLGESASSRFARKLLTALLLLGIGVFIWLSVFGGKLPSNLF
jgi:hypothetical protein